MTPKQRARRSAVLMWVLVLFAIGMLWRAAKIQIMEHEFWAGRAKRQIVRELTLNPKRGTIFDRNGIPMAISQERFEIGIAPREIASSQRDSLRSHLRDILHLPASTVRRLTDTDRRWTVVPGRYGPEARMSLKPYRGVYFTPIVQRAHPRGRAALPLLGVVGHDGIARGGIEAALDSLLRGVPGKKTVYRDAFGRTRTPENDDHRPPVPGADVVMTIDSDLQEAVAEILDEAIERTAAEAGDVVVLEVATGDILAMVGRRANGWGSLSAVNTPYEPGSVMKPFAYAALLEERLVQMTDSVHGENGRAVINGRIVSDVHAAGWMTYEEAFAQSSNIALVKTIGRLDPKKHHAYYKAFGFGEHPGLPIGGISTGLFRDPERWSKLSQGSLAIGYEIGATPLQIAVAYGALANNGVRMKPRLIQEIRYPDGRVQEFPPDTAGRVVSEETSREIRRLLRYVITHGSGRNADLGGFEVGGKTGTSRAYGERGYQDGYYASFAGIFPVDAPQIVIVVRIMRPKSGTYYGGAVAAPVARQILEAMLSEDSPPISREVLAQGFATIARPDAPPASPRSVRWRNLSESGRWHYNPSDRPASHVAATPRP